MIHTTTASRVLIFAPSQKFSRDSDIAMRFVNLCAQQELEIIRDRHFLLACNTSFENTNSPLEGDHLICDMLPGKIYSQRNFELLKDNVDWPSWHRIADDQAQLYNLIFSSQKEFSIESDILGLKPLYISHISEGFLISSTLLDMFRIQPDLMRPVDSMGLAQLILTGHPFGTRTIHSEVRRTKTGERLVWNSATSELISTRPRRLKTSESVRADAGLIESINAIDSALSKSVRRHTLGATRPLNIGLSGGFDSRILAAALSKNEEVFRAFTYGRWHHREVRTALRVAHELNVEHRILPYPLDNHYDQMGLFLSTMEGQSDSNSVQIANLLQLDEPLGAPMLHGFMSDAVAVTRFSDKKNGTVPNSLDETAINLASSILKSNEHCSFLSELVGLDINVDSVSEELRNDMNNDGLSYHSAVLWDVENRQRRFIAGHLPMLGQKFDVIVPFYDEELMSIWFSLPRISLDERYLQRQQLAKLYPNLARIPHSEEDIPITPNLSNQLRLLLDSLFRKTFIPLYQKAVGYRTSNIWSLSGGMATAEQQTRMRDLFIGNLTAAENTLGLDKFKSKKVSEYFNTGPSRGDYITPRIIYQTSEYAKWLTESLR